MIPKMMCKEMTKKTVPKMELSFLYMIMIII